MTAEQARQYLKSVTLKTAGQKAIRQCVSQMSGISEPVDEIAEHGSSGLPDKQAVQLAAAVATVLVDELD